MRHFFIPLEIALAAMAGAGAIGTAHAQTVEPGLWEIKSTMDMPNMGNMAEQMRKHVAQLPPEARKMAEQRMASMGMGIGQDGGMRVCFGPEQARQPIKEGQKEGNCTYTQVSAVGNTWRGRMVCTDPKSEGTFTTTMHSQHHFTTMAVLKDERGETKMTSDARRISADCGAIKPIGK